MATTEAAKSGQNGKFKSNKPFNKNSEGNGERKPFNRANANKGNAGKGNFNKTNNYSNNKGFAFKDKDEDDDKPVRRAKTVQKDSKPKEVQSDKVEIQNRIEKEKKAMKKKQEEAKKNSFKAPKQKAKPKRAGNVDWTRAYENDEYDDDDYDMYL